MRAEGPLHDVDPEHPPPRDLLVGDVALIDMFALAPYTAGGFPWACGLALAALLLVEHRRRRRR